jgi:hypothetical protein
MEELIRGTMGETFHIEVIRAAGLWTTGIDRNQLENALLNLCINARDAMPNGGRLTIETANRWLDEHTAQRRHLSAGQPVYRGGCTDRPARGGRHEYAAAVCYSAPPKAWGATGNVE